MKMKRLLASVLTLLLVVSILPICVMAEEPNNNPAGTTIKETDKDIDTNNGKIENNNHTVSNNVAVKRDSGENEEDTPSYEYGTGYIENNNNVVKTNGTKDGGAESGIVENNYGTVGVKDDDGSGNYGTINNNQSGGKVLINQNGGTVEFNAAGGTIETNNGTVGYQRWDGIVQPTSGNLGTIETNGKDGKVLINQSTGKIETNYGLVGVKDSDQLVTDGDTGNFGTVTTNYGIITQNENLVVTNGKDGSSSGYIYINDGTVKNNETDVCYNNGTVETNNGSVTNNEEKGIVGTNNSHVQYNYGTVKTNNIDGVVNNYNGGEVVPMSLDDGDAAPSEDKPVVAGVGTNFGTVTNYADNNKIYYGLSWGDSVDNLNSIESFVEKGTTLNLDAEAAKASRSGYKMTGYTAFARIHRNDEEIIGDTTNYRMNAPVWLQILWEKISGKAAPSNEPEVKTVKNTVLTSLSGDQVKVGAYVRRGNMTFRIIEVTDNDIRVATVGKLSEQDLADMLGCLKKHLSDAQIAKLIGEPELLEEELVTHFFGDNREHIAFRASRDLFA